ncbi:DEKNAAC101728 [Brettanomyces naardenensis]|uniref:Selenoprotein O n=1 Tax=Brettanomyces naardenensis TaxID=13370 RepID=A0A448YIV1_BRENA|nr:DEKNAAC101728 [Brettanomyces naardenensis]
MLMLDSKKSLAIASRRLTQVSSHLGHKVRPISTFTLENAPKTSSFTERLSPDPVVPTVEFAKDPSSSPELFHRARRLKSGAFTWVRPEERKAYKFLTASPSALKDLGFDPETEVKDDGFQKLVSGQTVIEDPFPYSQAYAGYQFGDFAGQLGDGRVVNLFEVTNPETGKRFELQLKGAGRTPFSRFADGKAVLRSSIREFIVAESLHAIGIPSTRALAITVLPKTFAKRSGPEKCAIVCRMAPSWVRVGTFDLYRYRGDRQGLIQLSNYVIDEVFKDELCLKYADVINRETKELGTLTKYDKLYFEIITRNAESVAFWQAYCFLNGVLNSDNTSVLGLAIDFGPFAFMDYFDPNYTSNHDDLLLRYSFKNTPSAIWFNMVKLGEDLAELIGAGPDLLKDEFFIEKGLKEEWVDKVTERAKKVIEVGADIYESVYVETYMKLVCDRLGITPKSTDNAGILNNLFETLQETKLDYNNFFAILQEQPIQDDSKFDIDIVASAFIPKDFKDDPFTDYTKEKVLKELKIFLTDFKARVGEEQLTDQERYRKASKLNPLFVPRNWILDEVIDYTQENDFDTLYLNKLLKMSSNPFDKSKWGEELKDVEDRWTSSANRERQMLQCSCSS